MHERYGLKGVRTHWCVYLVYTQILMVGCSRTTPPAEVVRPVKTQIVIEGEENHIRRFPGKVEASKRAELAFQVSGVITSLPVKEGQRIAKGEIIGQLRKDEFQARLNTLKGELDQNRAQLRSLQAGARPEELLRLDAQVRAAEAKLTNARSELDRYTRLIQSNAVARADFDRAQTTYRLAQEELKSATKIREQGSIARVEDLDAQEAVVRGLEARVVEANLALEDTTLRAPFDGVIAQRFVEVNQNVKAKQPIVRFQDVDEIEIGVDVPETVLASELSRADIVQLIAEISGAPGLAIPVYIREIGQVADPVTQTFKVRVGLQAPPGVRILPGMTATVTMTYRRANILGSRILVPIASVSKTASGEQVVWLIGNDGTVASRSVKVGAATGEQIEVLEGLQPGDRIVIAGVRFLRDGMKVKDLGNDLGGNTP